MKPKLYSVYQEIGNNDLWVVLNNSNTHSIQLKLVGSDGDWTACFNERCKECDLKTLILKSEKVG